MNKPRGAIVKVSELKGAALDYWVGKAVWHTPGVKIIEGTCFMLAFSLRPGEQGKVVAHEIWNPSDNWSQAGPIIEREHIALFAPQYPREPGDPLDEKTMWVAAIRKNQLDGPEFYGETPIIAAMRAFVASRFGETVED